MWFTDEVSVPDEIVDALLDDRLVIFVGAGASVRAPSGPEPVKLFETDCQEIFGATSAGCGLLIHAAPGSCGGVGALFTNRSGWAA